MNAGTMQITVGAGLKLPRGARVEVSGVAELARTLAAQNPGEEGWWAPHTWKGDTRDSDAWEGASCIGIDIDRDGHLDLVGKIAERLEAAAQSGGLSGSVFHRTPAGARIVFALDRVCTNPSDFIAAAEGAAQAVAADLVELSIDGVTVDPKPHRDLARLYFLPNTFAKGRQRKADVVVLRTELYRAEDLAGRVSDPAPVNPSPRQPERPGARTLRPFDGVDEEPRARSALASLDPACPYDEWVQLGQALHAEWPAEGGPGFRLWDEWSSGGGEKYRGTAELERKWRTFEAGGGVRIGTLFHKAKAAGWRPPGRAKVSPVAARTPGDPTAEPGDEGQGAAALESCSNAEAPSDFDLAPFSIAHHLRAEAHALDHGIQRITTGWPRLDEALGGGFAVPSLNLLGAAPKSGKSTWAQHVATHHLDQGGAVFYLDLENGRRRYLRQLLCRRAGLGPRGVAQAMENERAGVFTTRDQVDRWQAAKGWLTTGLPWLWVAFRPPDDWMRCLRAAKAAAGEAQLLVVTDSLQKLPGDLKERRATIDGWIRLFEQLRHELDLVFLVISEIKRGKEGYRGAEDAFKESGGIEYAADLAMTMDRPSAAEEEEEPVSTLRVELARDTEDDPRGDVASYRPVRPHYGLEEIAPVARKSRRRPGPKSEARDAAGDFLRERLAAGPARVGDLLTEARRAGISESSLRRAGRELGLAQCTMGLKTAWRLP